MAKKPKQVEVVEGTTFDTSKLKAGTVVVIVKSNKVVPNPNVSGSHKQYSIVGLSAKDIEKILGFKSNVDDDPNKVKYSWGFTVAGKDCAIWDYEGSYKYNEFSAWGDFASLVKLFGEHVS